MGEAADKDPRAGIGGAVSSPRVREALERVLPLLGFDDLPPAPEDGNVGEAEIERRAMLALERLPEVVSSMQRRMDGLLSVQRALAELRTVGSVELMMRRCTQVVCERCGFDRAILYRIVEDRVYPASAFRRGDDEYAEKVQHFAKKLEPPVLNEMVLETEMLRRRAPVIVHDSANDPRTHKPWVEVAGVQGYVAAPIVPGGRAIGFLHAAVAPGSTLDVVDRDVLSAFTEGCGYALERTLLRDQVRRQREVIRNMLRSADDLIGELGETELALTDQDEPGEVAPSLPAGGSRIHGVLTPREIEVTELLVQGLTNRQIADRMVVTESTIKAHVSHVYQKLHASNRAEAVHRYMRLLALDHR